MQTESQVKKVGILFEVYVSGSIFAICVYIKW